MTIIISVHGLYLVCGTIVILAIVAFLMLTLLFRGGF
jgi:hypothetical protein